LETREQDEIEDLLRECAPQVLGALVRRHGDFDTCEDAVQEALLAAAQQWPDEGVPASPLAWLTTVASRRRIEMFRAEAARTKRERTDFVTAADDPPAVPSIDDTLTLFVLCCHPSLTTPSQIALTLRAVGGLTTGEIARALLVPEPTIGQRISRAKKSIRNSGAQFVRPSNDELQERLGAVVRVLYLIFNEGYTASEGDSLTRVELSTEAIRLARQLHNLVPDDGEVAGLLALMLLTDARRPARTAPDGSLVPLAEQDRSRWDRAAIAEGSALVERALRETRIGPYQVQAAIAALHDEAVSGEATDWDEILALYHVLARLEPGPMVTLNLIVAHAMVYGAESGLAELDAAEHGTSFAAHHRAEVVRAHLLDLAGNHDAAREHYERAARATLSVPEQRYLLARARRSRN